MTILDERDDVAVGLVHRNATRLKTGLGDDDVRPPGLAAVLAARARTWLVPHVAMIVPSIETTTLPKRSLGNSGWTSNLASPR